MDGSNVFDYLIKKKVPFDVVESIVRIKEVSEEHTIEYFIIAPLYFRNHLVKKGFTHKQSENRLIKTKVVSKDLTKNEIKIYKSIRKTLVVSHRDNRATIMSIKNNSVKDYYRELMYGSMILN